MRRMAMVGAVLVLGAVVAGCEGEAPTGVSEAELYDPCTLAPELIRAAGADPQSKDDKPFGVARTGWVGCGWRGDGVYLDVFATTRTPDEYRANATLHSFTEVQVDGRSATTLVQGTDRADSDNCSVVFGTPRGTLDVTVAKWVDRQAGGSLCVAAIAAAEALSPAIPR